MIVTQLYILFGDVELDQLFPNLSYATLPYLYHEFSPGYFDIGSFMFLAKYE